ncbi:glycerol-3-phosphate dehydrogenase subunit C [Gammaproteobacteria bacterium]
MSASSEEQTHEGGLEAPSRHPLDWHNPDFYDEGALFAELERVFDVCNGCRRCFSLCHAFPTLFDAIDDSEDGDVEGLERTVHWQVVEHCYLCDVCYLIKCPYIAPHPLELDFPHLMLRAKVVKFRKGGTRLRDRLITRTDLVGKFASIPVVSALVNTVNCSATGRKLLDNALEIHPDAVLPRYHSNTLAHRLRKHSAPASMEVRPGTTNKGKVILFGTCYGNYNEPTVGEDLVKVFEHNGIPVQFMEDSRCCGMPKLELGDLIGVVAAKEYNIPRLAALVDAGWDIVAPIPSCVLMFKQELPLMFPDDPEVAKVKTAMFDPFEYLMLRHKDKLLNTDFKKPLGKVAYHIPCHLRVQNLGLKTRDCLMLVPHTDVEVVERCSGHDGTYAIKREFHEISMKIARPLISRVAKLEADWYGSDCPMAGCQIEKGLGGGKPPVAPITLLRMAYGL